MKNTVRFLLASLLAGTALAQGALPPPKAAAEASSDDEEGVPGPQWLDTANQQLADMRGQLSRGLDKLRDARDAKDAVALTCVNEQVTSMKGILRVSESALVSLQEALAARDSEAARYEYRKIKGSHAKMQDLYVIAVSCTSAERSSSSTSVELEVDPALVAADPYYGDTSFFFDPQEEIAEGDTGLPGQEDPPTVRPPQASGLF